MAKKMISIPEAANLIGTGQFVTLAGEESVLRQLPRGNWVGGTIPYFMTDCGGAQSRELLMATPLAPPESGVQIQVYDAGNLPNVVVDAPENGFTQLILPAFSPIHHQFAHDAPDFEDMYLKPVVGWVAGVYLDDLGKVAPKVVDGRSGEFYEDRGVAMHVPLPAGKLAVLGIRNLFKQGDGDVITFPRDGFSASDCFINGHPTNFARYASEKSLDPSRPLVADYNGAQINVSIQSVDMEKGLVQFYAPVFEGIEYKHAAPLGDYVEAFRTLADLPEVHPLLTYNCILNYLYGKLEGRKTGDYTGPITFGEIAYQLLNQTLVYLEIHQA